MQANLERPRNVARRLSNVVGLPAVDHVVFLVVHQQVFVAYHALSCLVVVVSSGAGNGRHISRVA
jgi:hypothetical protein